MAALNTLLRRRLALVLSLSAANAFGVQSADIQTAEPATTYYDGAEEPEHRAYGSCDGGKFGCRTCWRSFKSTSADVDKTKFCDCMDHANSGRGGDLASISVAYKNTCVDNLGCSPFCYRGGFGSAAVAASPSPPPPPSLPPPSQPPPPPCLVETVDPDSHLFAIQKSCFLEFFPEAPTYVTESGRPTLPWYTISGQTTRNSEFAVKVNGFKTFVTVDANQAAFSDTTAQHVWGKLYDGTIEGDKIRAGPRRQSRLPDWETYQPGQDDEIAQGFGMSPGRQDWRQHGGLPGSGAGNTEGHQDWRPGVDTIEFYDTRSCVSRIDASSDGSVCGSPSFTVYGSGGAFGMQPSLPDW